MADISEWSPVDESNTAAPPNGWPEGQATNTVNNCARAMMGAVRRWYDTVTEQLASLTSSLASYLPLAGGTLTGTLSAPAYQLSGVGFATRDAVNNFHSIYDADGVDGALHLGGAAAGYQSLYRAETHFFQSNTGGATFAIYSAVGAALYGSVTTSSNITAAGDIAGNILTGNAVNSNGHMSAVGNVTAANLISNGNLTVAGSGNVVGLLTAGTLSSNIVIASNFSTGAIDCDGNCEAVSYTRNGVPMVMLSQAQLDRIEARIADLERGKVTA